MFWSQLQKLRILLLHDNPIARVEVIHSLAACGRLQILTLYDSPLALKVFIGHILCFLCIIYVLWLQWITIHILQRNYRHHIANTLWSLKALDRHVISDEEIIEDAVFKNTRFATLGKLFQVDVCPPYPKVGQLQSIISKIYECNTSWFYQPGATFEEELIGIRNVMSQVNRIMAHYCPVLIIQKNIRFWLTYRRYRLYIASQIWWVELFDYTESKLQSCHLIRGTSLRAASTIQKAWRKYKKIPQYTPADTGLEELLTPSYLPLLGMPSTPPSHSASLPAERNNQRPAKSHPSVTINQVSIILPVL